MISNNKLFIKYIDEDQDKISSIELLCDKKVPLSILEENSSINFLANDSNKVLKKSFFIFRDNMYFYYFIDNQFYADINHVIFSLTSDLFSYQNTLKKFSGYISNQNCTQSLISKQPILRNLIDLNTASRIILTYDNEFSTVFKYQCAIYIIVTYYLSYYFLFYCGCRFYSLF